MLQQHAPVCVVPQEKVTVVTVPMDINRSFQDRTSKLTYIASAKGLTQMFACMPDKYAVNVYHCQGAGENGVYAAKRQSTRVA